MAGPDLLRRLDAVLAELAALRDELVRQVHLPAPAEQIGPDLDQSPDDLAPENLIEISTAVERFNRSSLAIQTTRNPRCARQPPAATFHAAIRVTIRVSAPPMAQLPLENE